MLENPAFIALLVAVGAVLATVGLALVARSLGVVRRQRRIAQELQAVTHADLSPAAQSVLREASLPATGFAARLLGLVPRGQDIAYRIEQSGLGWSLSQLLIFSALTASIAFAISLLLPVDLVAFGAPLLTAAGAAIPYLFVLWKRGNRWKAFERQLPDAAGLLGRAIRAGHPLSAGIRMVSEEMPAPASEEFRQMFEETRFGLPFEESLLGLADRIPLVDVRLMATAMLIQRDVGGNLAEMLDRVGETIRERFRLRKQIHVLTAEARMGAVVLMVLPIATAGLIHMVNPQYMRPLFEEHAGRMMLGGMVLLELVGIVWMRRITKIAA